MAEILATFVPSPEYGPWVEVYEWPNVTESDTCEAILRPNYSEVTMEVTGTLGTGVFAVQGNLSPQKTPVPQFHTLRALHDGAVMAEATLGISSRLENTFQTRPGVVSGAGAAVTIRLMFSGIRQRT